MNTIHYNPAMPVSVNAAPYHGAEAKVIAGRGNRFRVLFPRNGNRAPFAKWFNTTKTELAKL